MLVTICHEFFDSPTVVVLIRMLLFLLPIRWRVPEVNVLTTAFLIIVCVLLLLPILPTVIIAGVLVAVVILVIILQIPPCSISFPCPILHSCFSHAMPQRNPCNHHGHKSG